MKKFGNYNFSNLIGTVYKKGNVVFSNCGRKLLSPVGNRLTSFDLKRDHAHTLSLESLHNLTHVTLSPKDPILLAINEEGEAYLCSMVTNTVISKHHFHQSVTAVSFSPDGSLFAVAKMGIVLIYYAPDMERYFNQFTLHRVFYGASDDISSIDWTTDSKAFLAGSKDSNSRVYAAQKSVNLVVYSLGGHSAPIVGSFFAKDSLDVYSISENGQVCNWECDTPLDGMEPWSEPHKEPASDHNVDLDQDEGEEMTLKAMENDQARREKMVDNLKKKILYRRKKRFHHHNMETESHLKTQVTAVSFHKGTGVLVTGLEDGAFMLHQMPEFTAMHQLKISDVSVTSVAINGSGDWLALGCADRGQLAVWEWRSQTFIMKSESHYNGMTCLAYSPEGLSLATGGLDGKVKVWRVASGQCYVTFKEHKAGISGVVFPAFKPKVIISCSLDGTVRAFDLNRYRNFRTLSTPSPAQFSCLAVDDKGDITAAGCLDSFEAHVWSVQTGQLLVSLTGHGAPVSGIQFNVGSSLLATASWDGTLRLWAFLESKDAKDMIQLTSDALTVAFRPDGKEVAVSLLNGNIETYDADTTDQTGCISCHMDLMESDSTVETRFFQAIDYSADGKLIMAGGNSKYVCIYSVEHGILLHRLAITCNLSLEGVQEMFDRRKMSQWGAKTLKDDLGNKMALPGVRSGEFSRRHWKPEVRIAAIQASPTGQSFAVTTTEGLLIYSQVSNAMSDFSQVDVSVTPDSIREALTAGQFGEALDKALRLGKETILREVVEQIPVKDVPYICRQLNPDAAATLLRFISTELEQNRHLEFYVTVCDAILTSCLPHLMERNDMALKVALLSVDGPLRTIKDQFVESSDCLVHNDAYLTTVARLEKEMQN